MSIASEITRISGNVSDSLNAVAAKGVTVPTGSNSDDLAGLIAQISGGGGVDVESLSVTQNGTYTAPTGKAYSPVVVNVSGGGTTSKERKDVNFYDYDGTIVESYTTAEFANISALPSNPSHTGLTAQGWNMPSNWTLVNAKTYISTNKKADWGQMYTTASGATEIDVEFTDPNRMSPNMSLAVNGTVSVDWGDGSSATTVTGSSLTSRKSAGPHTYPAVGKYTIKVTVSSGSWAFLGTNKYHLLYKNDTGNNNRVYANCVKAIRIGAGCTNIYDYAFYYCMSVAYITIPTSVTNIAIYAFCYCYNLSNITIPTSVTSIGNYAFQYCYALTNVNMPNSVTSIGNSAFQYCSSLTGINIPNGVTSIGTSAFVYDYTLEGVTIPNSVTSINTSAFQYNNALANLTIIGAPTIKDNTFASCNGLGSIHFKSQTPPTVSASSAFSNLPTDCKIYVPTGKLSAYTTASNYPSSSTYTYIEE